MKRHLILFTTSLCLSAPVVAQDSSYSDYESDGNNRQFNFNPGNMMNGMTNPMRNMFGSSRRGYDDYPGAGYPPPYPPTYGYPAYQPPHPGYAQPYQAPPAPAQATPYNYPSALPAPAAPAPAQAPAQAPAYEPPTAAGQPYQPALSEPAATSRYQFRPLEAGAAPGNNTHRSSSQAPAPTAAGATQSTPLAPISQPMGASSKQQPMAPFNYPDPASTASASPAPANQAPAPDLDSGHRFRPLDKPGYSDLDQ